MNSKLLLSVLGVSILCTAAVVGESAVNRPAPEQSYETTFKVVGQARGTVVYALQYGPHACFVASTQGGSGISISCAK